MMHKLLRLIGALAAAVTLAAILPAAAGAAVTWTAQPVPLPSGVDFGNLSGVSCPASAFCVATDSDGGIDSSGNGAPVIEVWNGSTWTAQFLPLPSVTNAANVTAVSCASTSNCVAIGSYPGDPFAGMMAEVWNGSTWTAMALPEPSRGFPDGIVRGVSCSSATRCTAVGDNGSTTNPGTSLPLAERWNGSTWTVQAPPAAPGPDGSSLYGVSCPAATSCTAVGTSQFSSAAPVAFIERWNGSSWTMQPSSLPAGATGAALDGVSCTGVSACFAAGTYTTNAQGNNGLPLAMREQHGSWSPSQPPVPAGNIGILSGISCVKPPAGASQCTAAGYYTKNDTTAHRALAEFWNGRQWTGQPTATPAARRTLEAVSCIPGGPCTAVGDQIPIGSKRQPLAEQN